MRYRSTITALVVGMLFFGAADTLATDDFPAPLPIYGSHYPPYSIEPPLEGLRGFDVEVAIAAFSAVGVDVDIQLIPWKRAKLLAKKGVAAAALSCRNIEPRKDWALFSDPISHSRTAFITRKDAETDAAVIKRLSDLAGVSVISVGGYALSNTLTASGIVHETTNDEKGALNILIHRKTVDVFYNGIETTRFTAKRMGVLDRIVITPEEDAGSDTFHVCFSKLWPDAEMLVEKFNRGLRIIRDNGTYDTIHAHYR